MLLAKDFGVQSLASRQNGRGVNLQATRSTRPVVESGGVRENGDFRTPTVFVIDPDPATGTVVKNLFQGQELAVQTYVSGREFFAAYTGDRPGCLVLEQRIFDISGLQIQQRLARQNQRLPMIYVAAHMDVSTAVILMRGGAIHVLEKPLRTVELLAAIQEAVALDQNERRQMMGQRRLDEAIAMLTNKERQMLRLFALAKSTKAIAAELQICSRAVELRRRSIMDKLGLKSSLELLRFAMLTWEERRHCLEFTEG